MSISISSQCKDLSEFLAKHSSKNASSERTTGPTHTRIGDKTLNVYGGAYVIEKEELSRFYTLYYDSVFVKKKEEYLTEKQLDSTGPILIDLDFRYEYEIETRQHKKAHVQDLINVIYLELLKEFFVFEEERAFPIFVMEKPHVNRLSNGTLTKDGIHIIIGVQMDHTMQVMLREKVLARIHEIWELPIINDWSAVLDEGISKGTTNWQLYGSRKPGNTAYELTQYYTITYDSVDKEFMMDEHKVSEFDISSNLCKLSAQYDGHPVFSINPKIKADYEKRLVSGKKSASATKRPVGTKTKLKLLESDKKEEHEDAMEEIALEDIVNAEILKKAVDRIMAELRTDEYDIREIHDYTQILPEKYYAPGSHEKNRMVAFALKHTDDRLFLSWVMLRSNASDFDYSEIPDLYNKWSKYFKERPDGVTKKSIIYWAKQDAFDEYIKVKENTRDYFIEQTISSPYEFDFAVALKYMFKDKYVCTSIAHGKWYVFKNHRWVPDLGETLRLAISKEMFKVYLDMQDKCMEEMQHYINDQDDIRYKQLSKRGDIISANMVKMKKSAEKDKIMRESAPLFYDGEFESNMDINKYLMCFTNGIVDFKNKLFRDGYPQDYITKCTGSAYVPFNHEFHGETAEQLITFMEQLFPSKSLNRYMWDHLAATLIGENINQTFNIYRGSGSNGKSILTDLMTHSLGEYKGTVPITLVTNKRNSIGGTSSEVMQLKGVRYAVMQEPSKDSTFNEGVMKELTGGDPIQARALYCESETFIPQFSLVVCTNSLFEITSNDDGTWRRICICDFISKFVDPATPGTVNLDDNPYQFPKDKSLKDKLPKWGPIFMSMLVKRVFETQGVVELCDEVMQASKKYRQGQDHIAAFVSDMVVVKDGGVIAKRELVQEFKKWFEETQGSRKVPKGVELHEYMDLKFGKANKNGWRNVSILYPDVEETSTNEY